MLLILQAKLSSSHGKSVQRRVGPRGHFATYFEDPILYLRKCI